MDDDDSLHARPSPRVEDPTTILADSILRLSSLIDEQNILLRRKDQRKECADTSRQPIPEVQATSSSAWNALLRSTMSDVIQPKAEGWRSGLDALLVFLGLFSAIVTAFIVPSLATLKQDEVARTNELLLNLTNIVISISAVNASHLNLVVPPVFAPASDDVRFNVYLTLSLIISLSIGALAIACRGFLNQVSWSHHNKAAERLTDIRIRWKSAEKILGPAIESLHQLLIIPVLLFIVGLVDSLFSIALQVSSPPVSILVTSSLSVLFVSAVAVGMSFTLLDGILRPTTSPFQSRLAHFLRVFVVQRVQRSFHRLRKAALTTLRSKTPIKKFPLLIPAPLLSTDSMKIYHEILQSTRDDDILDEASAALFHVIRQRTTYHSNSHRFFRRFPVDLLPQECATLLHLLSPEASVRSHRTAAQVIVDTASDGRARPLRYSQNDIGRLLPILSQAARRADPGSSLSSLWNSQFLRAMGIVANSGAEITAYPPAVVFLGAKHWSWKYLTPSELYEIFAVIFEVLDEKITEELADADDTKASSVVDAILSTPDLSLTSARVAIDPRNVFASLLYLPRDQQHLMSRVLPWLMQMYSPAKVIASAQEHIETIQRSEWLHLLGHREYSMVPRLVSGLGECCFAMGEFAEHEMLVRICILCLLHTPSIRSRPPAGFVFFARTVLKVLLLAVKSSHVDLGRDESSGIVKDLWEIRSFVEEDLLWKEGRLEMLRDFDEILGDSNPSKRCSSVQASPTPPDDSPEPGMTSLLRSPSPDGQKYHAAEAGQYGVDQNLGSLTRV
ncbi:hypothetical protein B0H19DRAFT_1104590 [Mycena capillaripes]|nr:hypothetical protein B0H19DRAFT_1104590 [Mycena capillaripes]